MGARAADLVAYTYRHSRWEGSLAMAMDSTPGHGFQTRVQVVEEGNAPFATMDSWPRVA